MTRRFASWRWPLSLIAAGMSAAAIGLLHTADGFGLVMLWILTTLLLD